MAIFACRASRDFAAKVIEGLNATKSPEDPELRLGNLEVTPFSDGEFQPAYMESVRGATVFLIQSTFPPAENLMELLLCIDAPPQTRSSPSSLTSDGHARTARTVRASPSEPSSPPTSSVRPAPTG